MEGVDLLLSNIKKHITLSDEDIELITSVAKSKKVRRRQYLVQAGDLVRYENFVVKGCLRSYYIDNNGTEHIMQFAVEDWWISDFQGVSNGTPAILNVDALEDTEVLQIDRQDMAMIYDRIPQFNRYFRIILTNSLIAHQLRVLYNISSTAEERYLFFRQKYPIFEQRVPQHQIASYLGITPEFLSKIRKKLTNGNNH